MNIENVNIRAGLSSVEILTTEDVALILKRSKDNVYKLMQAGKLKYTKPTGKVAYFSRADIEEFVKKNNQ